MSDTEMAEKLATWSHAHQLFSNNWFTYKWHNWTEATKWLNPVNPLECFRAVPFPMQQPDFAEEFALKIDRDKQVLKFSDIVGEAFYDASVSLFIGKQSAKRLIKSLLPGK